MKKHRKITQIFIFLAFVGSVCYAVTTLVNGYQKNKLDIQVKNFKEEAATEYYYSTGSYACRLVLEDASEKGLDMDEIIWHSVGVGQAKAKNGCYSTIILVTRLDLFSVKRTEMEVELERDLSLDERDELRMAECGLMKKIEGIMKDIEIKLHITPSSEEDLEIYKTEVNNNMKDLNAAIKEMEAQITNRRVSSV